MSKDEKTVAEIAGNILVHTTDAADHTKPDLMRLLVSRSIELARAIVAEVQRTQPTLPAEKEPTR